MRIKILNNTAFSLLEILLASIIFIISVGGIFATLNAVRAPVVAKENALTAAIYGKQVLEALRSQVTNPQGPSTLFFTCSSVTVPCPDFALSVGAHQVTAAQLALAGIPMPAVVNTANGGVLNFTVTCADGVVADCLVGQEVAHRVDLNLLWTG